MDEMKALSSKVREIAYAIHVFHGNGYLEKVYENVLVNRLKKAGFSIKQQYQRNRPLCSLRSLW